MNGPQHGPGPGAPVLTLDLLADLHAGVLDPATEARLWPLARADRDAAAVLAALDATEVDLRGLGAAADTGPAPTPSVTVPDAVAARLDAALAALGPPPRAAAPTPLRAAAPANPFPPGAAPQAPGATAPHAPLGDLAAARARRSRRWVPAVSVAAAAVVVAAVGVGSLVGTGGSAVEGSPQAAAPTAEDLGPTLGPQAFAALGRTDYGPLTDAATREACLAANGVPAGTTVLGASEVVLDGTPGVLFLLPGAVPPGLVALVVGPTCSATDPATVDRQDIGAR